MSAIVKVVSGDYGEQNLLSSSNDIALVCGYEDNSYQARSGRASTEKLEIKGGNAIIDNLTLASRK